MKSMKYQNLSISIFNLKIKSKNWVFGFISLFFLAGVSSFIGISFLYATMLERSIRLPNIEDVEKEARLNLLKDFVDKKFNTNNRYNLVLGDSQSYGFRVPEEHTFAYIIDQYFPEKKAVNLSLAGGMAKDALLILKLMRAKNIKLDTIIYNVDIRQYKNEVKEGFGRLPRTEQDQSILLHITKLLKNYWVNLLAYEIIGWNKSERLVLDQRFIIEGRGTTNFQSEPRHNIKYLLELLDFIKSYSDDHLMILDAFSETTLTFRGVDRNSFLTEVSYFKNLLKKNGGKMKDLTFELNDEDFFDAVHLTIRGHKKVAEILIGIIAPPHS